ncbi:MAG: hypothetical protein GY842_27985 [bacterium]|nr:hypothetical protein [bacterium]
MVFRGLATAICRHRPRRWPSGHGGLRLLATLWLVAAPCLEAQAGPRQAGPRQAARIDSLFSALPVASSGLTIAPRVTLEAVRLKELSEESVEAGSAWRRVDRDLQALGAAPTSVISTVVIRRLPDLWRLRIPGGTTPDDLEVSYELIAANGRRDRLNHDRRAASEIEVHMRPLPVIVLESQGDGTVVQGGLELEIDVSEARVAGTYLGSLTTTVTNL